MFDTIRRLANQVSEVAIRVYNGALPTLQSAKATLIDAYETVENLVYTGVSAVSSTYSLGHVVLSTLRAGYHAVKAMVNLGSAGVAAYNKQNADNTKAMTEAGQDWKNLTEAASEGANSVVAVAKSAGDSAYYAGATVCNGGKTIVDSLRTTYEALTAVRDAVCVTAQGVQAAYQMLPAFRLASLSTKPLSLSAPEIEMQIMRRGVGVGAGTAAAAAAA